MRLPSRILALVAALLLVAGCSSSDETASDTTTTAAPAATVAAPATVETTTTEATTTQPGTVTTAEPGPTTTAVLVPVAHGPTVLVAGREDCQLDPPARVPMTSTDADGTVHFRDGEFECTVVNNDPRIAGTAYYTIDMDRWGASVDDTAQVMTGTIRIENAGGAWEATYVGVYTSEWGDVFTALFTGTGTYEGLTYYQWAVETFGSSWPTKGLIFPGSAATP